MAKIYQKQLQTAVLALIGIAALAVAIYIYAGRPSTQPSTLKALPQNTTVGTPASPLQPPQTPTRQTAPAPSNSGSVAFPPPPATSASSETAAPSLKHQAEQTSQNVPLNNSTTATTETTFSIVAKNFAFTPDTLTVRLGEHVTLNLTSIDVTHGFTLPQFNVSVVLPAHKTQTVDFVANKLGTFSFYSSVYSGEGSADMKGTISVIQ